MSLISTPLVFIGGSPGFFLAEPTWGANELLPRQRSKAVGPTGPSADQGGRSATQWRQPPPISYAGLVWASSGLNTGVELVLTGFASVLGLHLSI